MPKKRDWLEIEETDFVYCVIESSSILLSPEEAVDPAYCSGEKLHPAKEYAISVSSRTIPLVDRIYALNEVFALLEIERFPFGLGSHNFSRFEWLRLVIDLIHARFTSIRDSAVLISAAVFEMNQSPKHLKISSLADIDGTEKVVGVLRDLSAIGKKIRDARDLSFHRSELSIPTLDSFEQLVFSAISKAETYGNRFQGAALDLETTYINARNKIRDEYDVETKKIVTKVRDLFELLLDPFLKARDLKFDA